MRVRRMSTMFWALSIFAGIFVLYILTDLSFNLPSNKSMADEEKMLILESKLRHIEDEVKEHNTLVNKIRSAVDEMVKTRQKMTSKVAKITLEKYVDERKGRASAEEVRVVGDEPPVFKANPLLNMSTCPIISIYKKTVPKTDVQMLDMYQKMEFDEKDGGVWKQGWKIEYDEKQWSKKNKLKVFIVPHSHNDPGWIKTFEKYYETQTKMIFDNMVTKLTEGRKFIWAEVSFLYLWWTLDADDGQKSIFKDLLKSGRLEIVTGGWVMNDEANSHWLSITQQLTLGHQWLLDNLDYRPRNSWAIDPFGHSSTQPYLLKLAGFDFSVIQRVHYRVKKELALHKQLEFKWRQMWDGVGKTDMKTHMMPFYSYDAPHSCGPDPKICCQFDFKRLAGSGVTCPWGVPPKTITQKNIQERANLILDQWRKKAQLYKSNAVLIPLGDDFRYNLESEWDDQYKNYEQIIEYINNNPQLNAEIQFGTLEDYFQALREEIPEEQLPVLSGDFFTYADRNQHYWSGYYTSRPFYKNMDRVLLAYFRAAEVISAQATLSKSVKRILSLSLRDRVETARQALALFQHHDGVTGTSRTEVKMDYADKMVAAIALCQSVIQQSAYFLLKQPRIQDQVQDDVFFDPDHIYLSDELPSRMTIALDELQPTKSIVVYNSLTYKRQEFVTVIVNKHNVEIKDANGKPVWCQVSPVLDERVRFGIQQNKYQVTFLAELQPLSVAVYSIDLFAKKDNHNMYTIYSRIRIYNADYWTVNLPDVFNVEQPRGRFGGPDGDQPGDLTVQPGSGTKVVANTKGFIKAIVRRDGAIVPVHMDFKRYGSMHAPDNNSGAYLFIPDGPGSKLELNPFPEMVIMEGSLRATLYVAATAQKAVNMVLSITVEHNVKLPVDVVTIVNTFAIRPDADDLEISMRFSTTIANKDEFYTDLNGMQMIKRRTLSKLPLQANFYPMPGAAFIQDEHSRLTLLTSTPLGVAALEPGSIEIMQDRRLSRDDNRGLNQGVRDNVQTSHTFKLVVDEPLDCQDRLPDSQPSGLLSADAHIVQQNLLHPYVVMFYTPPATDLIPPPYAPPLKYTIGADIVLASFHTHVKGKNKNQKTLTGTGLTFQRVALDTCYSNPEVYKFYPIGSGQIFIGDLTGANASNIMDSSLTYTRVREPVGNGGAIALCPMEIRSVFVADNTNQTH